MSTLTLLQHKVIAALVEGQTVTKAAAQAGLHRTTIHHWRRTQPAFALALRDSERDLADHWRTETQARAEKALTTLDHLLEDERTPATVRLKAILHVLNSATTVSAPDPVEQQLQDAQERQQARAEEALAAYAAEIEPSIEDDEEDDEAFTETSPIEYKAAASQLEPPTPARTVSTATPIHHNSSLSRRSLAQQHRRELKRERQARLGKTAPSSQFITSSPVPVAATDPPRNLALRHAA